MRYFLLAAAVAAFARVAVTQTIDPNSVPISTRQAWCNSQIAQCPLICLQEAGNSAGTYANTCDAASLTYSCICSNGLSPNSSEYSQTLPYYICTQYNTNCQLGCGNDNTCAAACVQDHPCGALNPTRVNTSTITTMPATSTTDGAAASTASDGSVVYTGFGGGAAATTSDASGNNGSSGSSAASRLIINVGEMYGLAVVAAGIFFGFSVML
ncbi:hypothetical protein G647_03034 [Cladophialophora carrionii CBS 160.54]|uniref:DUF7707 domain-containing protein n=1 Tax=Cladophialophora carrionii CBS 160.54 TaxID=1279043 RepID=V9DJZ0_9EURO|nr:uncharacterized protein G647_03034 [Cladophialophora carrionii CBS 160.54]ETI26257.1 hypothetical protein G647_03034 [Cladophialophora carrionii CBS 160.54]